MLYPNKVIKTIPLVNLSSQGHPLHGALRYHKDVGWNYRYSTPFRITGKPSLPNSKMSKISLHSPASVPVVKRRARKPAIKFKTAAIRLKKTTLSVGLPGLRLRRIDQQPGFGSLLRLLNGNQKAVKRRSFQNSIKSLPAFFHYPHFFC